MPSLRPHSSWIAGILLSAFFALPLCVAAQQLNFRLQRDIMMQVEKAVLADTSFVHLGLKPIPMSVVDSDKLGLFGTDTTDYYFGVTELLLSKHLIHVKKKDFEVMIDPLLNFQLGEEYSDTLRKDREQFLRTNTRGLRVQGHITDKVSFMASFYENQAVFPRYVRTFVGRKGVVPGFGRVKPFGPIGYDFAMSTGYLVIRPTKFLRLQYGHDKNFVGHGYRSLLLSDNSFNYPHLRITWTFLKDKLQYTSVFGKIRSLRRMPNGETREPNFAPKGYSFNYLSFMPWRFLEIGIFESFVWKMYDTTTETRTPFIASTINPVILVNSFAYGFDNENNGLIGLNLRLQPHPEVQIYGQAVLDDLKSDKYGFQAGAKWFNVFLKNLELQVEYNHVEPYTYGRTEPQYSYTHNNEFLAHPWGAGFDELVGFVNYRWRRFLAELKVIYGQYQLDYVYDVDEGLRTHFGKDIVRSEADQFSMAAANPAVHTSQDLRLSYVINPSYNLMINAGITNRLVDSPLSRSNTTFLYIGLRTYIDNQYFDF